MRDTVFQYGRQSRPTIHDFINEAIRQVRDGGETISAVADRLGLRPALLRQWLTIEAPAGRINSSDEIISSLQQENQALRMECDRLRKLLVSAIGLNDKLPQG
ncbi:MAG: transposase [Candidatus Thiodiazotropha sp. (ex Dulcina madagascariensis)]|nr:transposase [Candidatus Thiodiazotropha sp. (ex Dulcina madagascariensis)]